MQLSLTETERFFKLYRCFLFFVNERLQIVPGIGSPEEFWELPAKKRVEVRNAFLKDRQLLDFFVDANPFDLPKEDLDIVQSWRHLVSGNFYVFRYLKNYTVFLTIDQSPAVAYGVVALSELLESLVGPHLPVWVEAVLLPYGEKIIYDSMLRMYNISFGGGIRRSLNATYKQAKQQYGVVTALPLGAQPSPAKKPAAKKATPIKSSNVAEEVSQVIGGMTDEFCREHLNDEYAELCRKLTEKLARKRPSPLQSGKPETWAAGIVRTIGAVNFLADRSFTPYMKLADIDAAFGISASTGGQKSKAIRDMFRIVPLDPNWCLPSLLDDNPLVWMVEVDGFIMDVRRTPRESQEIAFQKGLIPYIPADRVKEAVRE